MEVRGGRRLLLLVCLIYGVFVPTLQESFVSDPPENTVAEKGSKTQFFCKINGSPDQNAIYWGRILHPSGEKVAIYKTFNPDNEVFDEVKYNFTKTAPLTSYIVVNDVVWADAGLYVCVPMATPNKETSAHLVVVEKPSLSIPESLSSGKEAVLVCEFNYAGSDKMEEDGLKPTLTASIGDIELGIDGTESPVISNGITYKMKSEYTVMMKSEYHGQDFKCTVTISTSPLYQISSSQTLFLNLPVQDAKVDPYKEVYYPGEEVNCTADGYPYPEFTWIPEVSNVKDSVDGPVFIITPDMAGENQWRCVAKNVIDGTEFTNETIFSFKVEELLTGESKSNDVVIAVGVVVPIIVILLIILIIVVVYTKRKQSPSPANLRNQDPEKTGPPFQPGTDPLLNKKSPPTYDSSPEAGLLLPKVGPPKGDKTNDTFNRDPQQPQPLKVNDHTLAFSGDEDNTDVKPQQEMPPLAAHDGLSSDKPHSGQNKAAPHSGQATEDLSEIQIEETAQSEQETDDVIEQDDHQKLYTMPTQLSQYAGNTAL